jgi:hypothetical protein
LKTERKLLLKNTEKNKFLGSGFIQVPMTYLRTGKFNTKKDTFPYQVGVPKRLRHQKIDGTIIVQCSREKGALPATKGLGPLLLAVWRCLPL